MTHPVLPPLYATGPGMLYFMSALSMTPLAAPSLCPPVSHHDAGGNIHLHPALPQDRVLHSLRCMLPQVPQHRRVRRRRRLTFDALEWPCGPERRRWRDPFEDSILCQRWRVFGELEERLLSERNAFCHVRLLLVVCLMAICCGGLSLLRWCLLF